MSIHLIALILLFLAFVCHALAALGVTTTINLPEAGWACATLAVLLLLS